MGILSAEFQAMFYFPNCVKKLRGKKCLKNYWTLRKDFFSILSKTCDIKVGVTKVSILRVESLPTFSP